MSAWGAVLPGTGTPQYDNAPQDYTPALYADIAQVLAGGDLGAPQPTFGLRDDGLHLFYPGTTNGLVGAPESGKTLLASCVMADELFKGNSVLVVDVDHNGARATVARFISLGVKGEVLSDPSRFRYTAPEDSTDLLAVVAEAHLWKPTVALVDSVGEVLPMFGASSNDADQYTAVHRQVFTALANSGAGVILIDHEPKSDGAAEYGASGTMAKKRAIDGALYRVKVKQPFAPGKGGKALVTVLKDRHGQVNQHLESNREPLAFTFHLIGGDATDWKLYAPTEADILKADKTAQDVEALKALNPPPSSVRDVMERKRWGRDKSAKALKSFRELLDTQGSVPVPHLKVRGTGTTHTPYLEVQPGTHQVQVHGEGE